MTAKKALKIYNDVCANHVVPSEEKWSTWQAFAGRFKTEWGLLLNMGKAAGSAALQVAIAESPIKEKIGHAYQKRIEVAKKAWTVLLKKNRKQAEGGVDWEGAKPDNGDEAMAQKIHAYESKLIELTQRIDQSCEDFEKCMIDANQEFEKEFKISLIKK